MRFGRMFRNFSFNRGAIMIELLFLISGILIDGSNVSFIWWVPWSAFLFIYLWKAYGPVIEDEEEEIPDAPE